MIRRDTDYALRSLAHIAESPRRAVTAAELAAAQDVPAQFVQKILRRLARGGILDVRPGRGGGFSLATDPADVTLMSVIELVQGRPVLNRCMAGPGACPRQGGCLVTRHLRRFQEMIDAYLESTSLADILVHPRPSRVSRRAARRAHHEVADGIE